VDAVGAGEASEQFETADAKMHVLRSQRSSCLFFSSQITHRSCCTGDANAHGSYFCKSWVSTIFTPRMKRTVVEARTAREQGTEFLFNLLSPAPVLPHSRLPVCDIQVRMTSAALACPATGQGVTKQTIVLFDCMTTKLTSTFTLVFNGTPKVPQLNAAYKIRKHRWRGQRTPRKRRNQQIRTETRT
jgi:hypothetical protein